MLLPDNIHPINSVYYNGSYVLKTLSAKGSMNLLDLYQSVKELRDMSFPIFILCIDWLFLLDVITLNKGGEVELCF